MKKSTSPSFVLTLKLNTTDADERILAERFFYASKMRNLLISFARKRLRGMRQDLRYRELMTRYISLAAERDRLEKSGLKSTALSAVKKELSDLGKQLSDIRTQYGLSEYAFHAWIAPQQKKYRRFIDSLTAQRIASDVWQSVSTVIFRKGKTIHFKSCGELVSVCGKNNVSGIRFSKGKLVWNGLCIQPQIRRGDIYAREALTHRVKYCRILRKPMGTSLHFYLQLVLEGIPPKKHDFLESGRVGVDQGTSTEAVVSEHGCLLTELCPERPDIQKQIRIIQRRMDRSSRAMNPGNYKEDGTPKRHVRWVRSKSWKRDRMKLKTLYRRAADTATQSRERLADTVLCIHGSDIITESMNYKALQARSKETSISEMTGKYKRKKRFGGSIGRHAPAAFMAVLERKLNYINKTINHVDTVKYRASRYRHDTDSYEEHSLSDRDKYIAGCHVQRDLYSAFLLMNAADPDHPDRTACENSFSDFIKHQQTELIRLLDEPSKHPACMGLKDFQYLINA